MITTETKYLTEFYHLPEFKGIDGYKKNGGYKELEKALKMQPQAIIDEVKASGLRGRGGAGFSTGMKWGFLPKNNEPRYLLCNADEGEPGTFKDRMMMEKAPHQLIEGMIISGFAINSKKSYIYVRGEYDDSINALTTAIQEAYKAGYLGKNILGLYLRRRNRNDFFFRRFKRPAQIETSISGGSRLLAKTYNREQR